MNYVNLEVQPKETESAIKNRLKDFLTELKRFKFVTTLRSIKENISTSYFSSISLSLIIKDSDIDDVFQSLYKLLTQVVYDKQWKT